ncbi:MAG: ThuA domain-containing protein [Cellulosilyticaceae bacterium]
MKKVLIIQGGWDGHEPELVSKRFKRLLEAENFEVHIADTLEVLENIDYLKSLELIVACWTMGTITKDQSHNVALAVGSGVGLSGCHGGMCDSFRNDTEWQFMTGGQWVSHPGGDGIEYMVNICKGSSPITDGIEDFRVKSEHYYLHIDPSIEILATTRFPLVSYYHISNKPVDMPVAWTKNWGNGRVFYCSLGHHDDVFEQSPSSEEMVRRGMLWAAGGKEIAITNKLTTQKFENNQKMY